MTLFSVVGKPYNGFPTTETWQAYCYSMTIFMEIFSDEVHSFVPTIEIKLQRALDKLSSKLRKYENNTGVAYPPPAH